MGLNFSKNELTHVHFTSELKNFVTDCVFLTKLGYKVLHDFNLTYYSSIILGSFGILFRGVGSGPAGPVLAGPLFIKVKTKFHFAKSK